MMKYAVLLEIWAFLFPVAEGQPLTRDDPAIRNLLIAECRGDTAKVNAQKWEIMVEARMRGLLPAFDWKWCVENGTVPPKKGAKRTDA